MEGDGHGRSTADGKLIVNMDDLAYDIEELLGMFEYYGWSNMYKLFIMEELAKTIKGQNTKFAFDKPDPRLTREGHSHEDEIN